MKRVCPGEGCETEIAPGLLMCSECRAREAGIAKTQAANLDALEKSLAAHAEFARWLKDHDL